MNTFVLLFFLTASLFAMPVYLVRAYRAGQYRPTKSLFCFFAFMVLMSGNLIIRGILRTRSHASFGDAWGLLITFTLACLFLVAAVAAMNIPAVRNRFDTFRG